jgi:hypothetical protein
MSVSVIATTVKPDYELVVVGAGLSAIGAGATPEEADVKAYADRCFDKGQIAAAHARRGRWSGMPDRGSSREHH